MTWSRRWFDDPAPGTTVYLGEGLVETYLGHGIWETVPADSSIQFSPPASSSPPQDSP